MTRRSMRVAFASTGLALAVTVLGAVGLVADLPELAGLRKAYIPMAPSTAVVLVLLGLGVLIYLLGAGSTTSVPNGWGPWAPASLALVGALLSLTILVGRVGPVPYDIEGLVLGTAQAFPGDPASTVPVGRMSPLTAALGLGAALALALLVLGGSSSRVGLRSPKTSPLSSGAPSAVSIWTHFSSILAGSCVAVSAAVLVGYAYDTPLYYGGSAIPTALNTAVAFFALGVALVATLPAGVLITRPFETSTFSGRLLRTFLPLTAALVLAQGWVQTQIAARSNRNPALWAWVAALLSVGVVGLVVTVVSRRTGQVLTRAKAALAESERNLRLIAENTTDVIFAYSMDRRLLFANAAAGSKNPFEDVLDAGFIDRLHPDDRPQVEPLLAHAFFGAPFTAEFRVVEPGGEVKWFRSTVGPLFDEAGRQIGIQGREHDITELKEAEEALRLQEEVLLQSQKMEAIGQLAGGIAHDFNNLLTAMRGYGDIVLTDDRLDPALRPELEEIRKGVDRAANLTRQILTFSRRQVSSPRVLDLNECLENMHALLRRTLGEHLSLEAHFAANLWPVEADPSQMQQVMLNLAVNARDAMGEGGRLTLETANAVLDEGYVSTHLSARAGAHVMLAVSDTGTGMSPEVRARAFEPFFTTKPEGSGTGMGLSTVYGIIKQVEGNIWIYSEAGQGTTIKIYLPRSHKEVDWHPAPLLPSSGVSTQGTETILVVEDEPGVRAVVERVLSAAGYQVLVAGTPGEALTRAGEAGESIGLLLTDVIMPGMTGPELAGLLRARQPELRILFMSGYTKNAIVREGRLDPSVDLLEKPFSPESLARRVREALDR